MSAVVEHIVDAFSGAVGARAHDYRKFVFIVAYQVFLNCCHAYYFVHKLLRWIGADIIKFSFSVAVLSNYRPLSEERMVGIGKRFCRLRNKKFVPCADAVAVAEPERVVFQLHIANGGVLLIIESAGVAERAGSTDRAYGRVFVAVSAFVHHHYASAVFNKFVNGSEEFVIGYV